MTPKLTFLFCLLIFSALFPGHPAMGATKADYTADLRLSGGYRVDELTWTIAGNILGTNPNILSELTWENLEIFQLKGESRIVRGTPLNALDLCLRAAVGFGFILDGENQDSDFAGNNRTLEFSRSNNRADDGNVLDLSLGFGPQFRPGGTSLTLTPLIGFSYHQQNLTLKDGIQTLSDPEAASRLFGENGEPLPLGPFSGLDSNYDAEWFGPWAGFEVAHNPLPPFSLHAAFSYHWVDFEAVADWNLRQDFAHPISFEQMAEGEGFNLSLGGTYAVASRLSLSLDVNHLDWETGIGTDTTFLADGSRGVTKLNRVTWKSTSAMVGVTYRFF